jgi:hypothetical protein
MAKAKHADLSRKKKKVKKKAKAKKRPFLPKIAPAPLLPQPPASPTSSLLFGGFFGTKTDG